MEYKCDKCQQQFTCLAEDGDCSKAGQEFLELEREYPIEFLNFETTDL